MKILMCALILICTSAIGVNLYRNALKKLRLLEALRNMFFMFNAYITIEHCEIRECIRRYCERDDPLWPTPCGRGCAHGRKQEA